MSTYRLSLSMQHIDLILNMLNCMMEKVSSILSSSVHKDNALAVPKEGAGVIEQEISENLRPEVLIMDESESWQKVVKDILLERKYRCDVARTYDEAKQKIQNHKYNGIFLSQPFHTMNEWRNLLILLKEQFLEIPVIILSNDIPDDIHNIQSRYPNIKSLLFKGIQKDGTDFISSLSKAAAALR